MESLNEEDKNYSLIEYDNFKIDVELLDEILIHIFQYCQPTELLKLSYVSIKFNKLSNLNLIWDPIVSSLFKNKFTYWVHKNTESFKDNKKKIYFWALKDSQRNKITFEELTSMCWTWTGLINLISIGSWNSKNKFFPLYRKSNIQY